MNSRIKRLISEYKKRKDEIKARLEEFRNVRKGSDRDIFKELSFCILTANANALLCDRAIKELGDRLLLKGRENEIKPSLKGRVRFHNKKAKFIVRARNLFRRGNSLDIKERMPFNDIFETRDWLVRNINGFGYKEASHFLRNIGLGKDMAILDRHILKNLKGLGVISKIPPSVSSRKAYLQIEDRMRKFSKKVRIPLEELDLLFWSLETGFVFK